MLFAIVALMAVGSAIAIIGGEDAVLQRFPYFAHLKIYKRSALCLKSVILLLCFKMNLKILGGRERGDEMKANNISGVSSFTAKKT